MNTSYQLNDLDPSIIVEPKTQANAAVIWLHGLGADGHDFVGLLPQLNLPKDHAIRFIFPHAPVQPVTVNGGMAMRSWYDIYSMSIAEKMDLHSIGLSTQVLNELIQQQLDSGIAAQKILIAGFSQGGLITLNAAINSQWPLAGAMALSTYYPAACIEALQNDKPLHQVPILMVHGEYDPVVPFNVADSSKQRLLGLGLQVEWHQYPMEHQVCAEEVAIIADWIANKLIN